MSLIAVTGGIGAGKTTLVGQFKALGACVADADALAHDVYLPGKYAYNKIVEKWGEIILDGHGRIDRKAVAEIVFSDTSELNWLNNLVHPCVRREILDLASDCGEKPLFCAIPLLFESDWREDCKAVIAAWCPPDVQLQRLKNRGWSDDEITKRLGSQISMDEKMLRADYCVVTSCTWDCLGKQCKSLMEQLG